MLLVAASRTGDAERVGRVAIVSLAFQIVLGVARSLLGEVALVRTPFVGKLESNTMIRSTLALGIGVGSILFLSGVAAQFAPLIALGLFVPGLLVQDSLRHVSFAQHVPWRAARADVVWVASFSLYLVALRQYEWSPSDTDLVAVWCGFGTLSIFLAAGPDVWRGIGTRSTWIRDSSEIVKFYVPEYFLGLAVATLPPIAVAFFGGVSDVGGLRLAFGFLGPITVFWSALINYATAALVGVRRDGVGVEIWLTLVTMGVAASWTIVGMLVPDELAARWVGESWHEARE